MASGGSGLELWLVLSGSAHVVIPKSGERVEKMMMNQSRCGMLLLVDQLRERDVEKWGLPMLNITSVVRDKMCSIIGG